MSSPNDGQHSPKNFMSPFSCSIAGAPGFIMRGAFSVCFRFILVRAHRDEIRGRDRTDAKDLAARNDRKRLGRLLAWRKAKWLRGRGRPRRAAKGRTHQRYALSVHG